MTRTKGAKDLKKRKKRKLYAGKPIKKKRKKSGKYVPYISKRDKQSKIKLWFWTEEKMSKEGYKRFPKDVRQFVRKIVYKPKLRIDISPEDISTKEKVEALAVEHLWEGTWLMKGFSHGKNKFHVKNVTLCKIKITDHPEGLRAKLVENKRLFRYWFWRSK